MNDFKRYRKIVREIEEWLENHEHIELALKEAINEIPDIGDYENNDAYRYSFKKYLRVYKKIGKIEYRGHFGQDAFHEAREDLKFFKIALRKREAQKLKNPREFDKRFLEKLKECNSNEEAYKKVEEEHRLAYGTEKYTSYNSFQTARAKRIKRKVIV